MRENQGYCQIMKYHLDRLTDAEYQAILKDNPVLQNFVKAVNYERSYSNSGKSTSDSNI